MKLRDTLNLGQTDFPMRANLPTREKEFQKQWEADNLYEKIQEKNADKPTYVLHDGPPYANGKLHIGHALNKISKDFIVRSKSMMGYRAPYVPGWDTHGLPIEQALINQDGLNRDDYTIAQFRDMCEEYALKQIDDQKEDFKRLGVTGDWKNPYLTLTPEFEAAQIRVFGQMAEKGYIYRGSRPVYWSPSSRSSLAEAEIEYDDVVSPSIFVAFDVLNGKDIITEDASFVVWTTTPWTLPANLGISVAPDAYYSQVSINGKNYILAEELVEELAEKFGWDNYEITNRWQGKEFDRLTAKHPFYDRESLLMVGDHVALNAGTGLVHTAPGHGEEDFEIGQAYGLEILSPVDDRGHFTKEAPGFEDMYYIRGNREVLKMIEESGHLLFQEEYHHSYPHDWRTKQPIIYRATPQWFASIESFREEILESVEKEVKWYHPSGKTRMFNMVRDRGDWVISRQRVWGVPLPIFYAENGEAIIDPSVIKHVADLVEEHGSNVWFEREAKDLLPEGYTHEYSPNGEFTKEMDIMDVWFDSGSSWAGVLQERDDLTYPSDLYLEGSDQYRGWFNSSLTTSVAVNGHAPYRAVLSQGFVMDGQGVKMSKSLGNVITPEEVMQELGADIIRLWASSVDSEYDVRISQDILKQVAESYRRIRNTLRFMLANTSDFDPEVDMIAEEELRSVDQYMLAKFRLFVAESLELYEKFDFLTINQHLGNLISNELSAFYLDFSKDVVYIEAADSYERRAMQTVFYKILRDLIPLMSPILVHTMEEAWSHLPGTEGYVQMAEMPKVAWSQADEDLVQQWAPLFEAKTYVARELEAAKNYETDAISKPFEASVTLYTSSENIAALEALKTSLDQVFIVSKFDLRPLSEKPSNLEEVDGYAVAVERAPGEVCDRCRAVRPEVGEISQAPELCQRCYDVVNDNFPKYFES